MSYIKSFPYTLKYKGSSYVINKFTDITGSYTTIQKDGGTVYTFDDVTYNTPAFINFIDGTNGVVGGTTDAQTLDLDAIAENLFIMHEDELGWGKQNIQNFLNLMEKIDTVRQGSQLVKSPLYWMGMV